MIDPRTHRLPIVIKPDDIDFMGHVNNATYLTWVQDAVLAHWRRWAPPEAAATRCWVAVRHEITYRRPAFLRDRIFAETTLDRVRRESAFYDTSVRRSDEVLAEVTSRWCCLDAATLRPIRLAPAVIAIFFPNSAKTCTA